MTRHPADYKWSSYSAYLGTVNVPEWLSVDTILNLLAETKSLSAVKNYQDYVEGKSIEEINIFSARKLTAPIIGSEIFKDKILSNVDAKTAIACSPDIKRVRTVPEIELIISHVCSFYNINRELLVYSKPGTNNWPRVVCIYICRRRYGHTLRAIAHSVGFHRPESVSTAVRKCHSRLLKYPRLSDELNNIVARIQKAILQNS